MMQIMIDIPDRLYDNLPKIHNGSMASKALLEYVKNGTPIPKGHGDLVDLKELTHKFWDGNYMEIHKDDLSKIKAIIPAERSDAE